MVFFLKKNKIVLSDLLTNTFIDIHSHLLPGIDDGAKNLDESILLINELCKNGLSNFITTPHTLYPLYDNKRETILEKEQILKNKLLENQIDVDIKAASEYMLDGYFLDKLNNENLLTLKDNYILVEMSYINPPIQLMDILFQIQIKGYKPILAHPERYLFYHHNLDLYKKLKNAGCSFQLNLLSTTGYYGDNVAKACEKLLKNGMIDFVGTDIHHTQHIKSLSSRIVINEIKAIEKAISQNEIFSFS